MRVSRAWNYACRNRGLWADLKFVKCWRDIDAHPFRPGVLNDIISKRSQNLATSLTITSMTDFNLDDRQLNTILRALPQLNRLSIQVCSERDIVYSIRYSSLANPDRLLAAINEGASSTLEVLQLRNLHKPEDLTNSGSLFSRVSEYLKELSLVDLTGSPMFTKILGTTEWPKLEKLTITGAQIPVRSYPDIDIVSFLYQLSFFFFVLFPAAPPPSSFFLCLASDTCTVCDRSFDSCPKGSHIVLRRGDRPANRCYDGLGQIRTT